MKKSIILALILIIVCAGVALSQTRKKAVRRAVKTTAVKRTVTTNAIAPVIKSAAVTTASGLTYVITQPGTGAPLKTGDTVVINYTGLLTSGLKFDSSFDHNGPFTFPLGTGQVIKGWDEGVSKLRVGDRATLIIPPDLGYGARGTSDGTIPPDATLIFIVEVVGVQ